MRYVIDFEFHEDGRIIDPISLGIAAEDGRTYYAVFNDTFDPDRCNDWVKEHVLPKLPWKDQWKPKATIAREALTFLMPHHWLIDTKVEDLRCSQCAETAETMGSPKVAADPPPSGYGTQPQRDFSKVKNCPEALSPEIWGYYADYDWVALCQLYGRMVDLPKGMPYYCLDINQYRRQLGLKRQDLPPDPADEHHALADAKWGLEALKICDRAAPRGIGHVDR